MNRGMTPFWEMTRSLECALEIHNPFGSSPVGPIELRMEPRQVEPMKQMTMLDLAQINLSELADALEITLTNTSGTWTAPPATSS
jgi:hypothetical protein